jgi:hypothetical protein
VGNFLKPTALQPRAGSSKTDPIAPKHRKNREGGITRDPNQEQKEELREREDGFAAVLNAD